VSTLSPAADAGVEDTEVSVEYTERPHAECSAEWVPGERSATLERALKGARGPEDFERAIDARGARLSDADAAAALVQMARAVERGGQRWAEAEPARRSLRLLEAHLAEGAARYEPRSITLAVLALAKLDAGGEEAFAAAADALRGRCAELSCPALANTAHAFALRGHGDFGLLEDIAAAALPRLQEFQQPALYMLADACGRLRCAPAGFLDAVGRRCVRFAAEFPAAEVAGTLRAFAELGERLPTLLEAFAAQVLERSAEFRLPELVGVAHAYATLDYSIAGLPAEVADRLDGKLVSLTADEVAALAWSLARLGHRDARAYDGIAARALGAGGEGFPAPAWAAVVWALAASGNGPSEEVLSAAEPALVAGARELSTRDLSNTVWACARVRRAPSGELLQALCAEAARRAPAFHPVEVHDFVQSCSKLRHRDPAALEALGGAAARSLGRYNDRLMTDIVSGLAALGHPHPALFAAVERRVLGSLGSMHVVGLVHINWAFTCEEAPGPEPGFFEALNGEVLGRRKGVKPDHLAKLLLRQAMAGCRDDRLCREVAARAEAAPAKFDMYAVAGAAYGLARLGYDAPGALAALRARALELSPKLRSQCVVSLASAFRLAGEADRELFAALVACAEATLAEFAAPQLAELAAAVAWSGVPCEALLEAVAEDVSARAGSYTGGDLDLLREAAAAASCERLADAIDAAAGRAD